MPYVIDLRQPRGKYGQSFSDLARVIQSFGQAERQRQEKEMLNSIMSVIAQGGGQNEIAQMIATAQPSYSPGFSGIFQKLSNAVAPQSQMMPNIANALIGQAIRPERTSTVNIPYGVTPKEYAAYNKRRIMGTPKEVEEEETEDELIADINRQLITIERLEEGTPSYNLIKDRIRKKTEKLADLQGKAIEDVEIPGKKGWFGTPLFGKKATTERRLVPKSKKIEGAVSKPAPGKTVKMLSPDGKSFKVDVAEVKEAEEHGWELISPSANLESQLQSDLSPEAQALLGKMFAGEPGGRKATTGLRDAGINLGAIGEPGGRTSATSLMNQGVNIGTMPRPGSMGAMGETVEGKGGISKGGTPWREVPGIGRPSRDLSQMTKAELKREMETAPKAAYLQQLLSTPGVRRDSRYSGLSAITGERDPFQMSSVELDKAIEEASMAAEIARIYSRAGRTY